MITKGGNQRDVIYQVLSSCWESTSDPGPYAFGDSKPDWDSVLQGDISYLLMMIRQATHGPEYSFKVQCDVEYCRHRFEWQLNLNDLPVQMMTDEHRAQFAEKNEFHAVVGGQKYTFILPTGGTAKRAARVSTGKRGNKLSFSLRMRITGIEGVESNDLTKRIVDMEISDLMPLIDVFDEHDCGVDGTLDVECEECGGVQEMQVPFEGEFFFPRSGRKAKKDQGDTSSTEIHP